MLQLPTMLFLLVLLRQNKMCFVYFYLSLCLFCLIYTGQFCTGSGVRGSGKKILRVIGGRDARPGEFPYAVRLEAQSRFTPLQGTGETLTMRQHLCSASALSRTALLSAKHCCLPEPSQPVNNGIYQIDTTLVVRLVSSTNGRPTDTDSFFDVLRCLRPSERSAEHPVIAEDLALLETQPLPLSEFLQLSALDYTALIGRRVTVLGYGVANGSAEVGGPVDDTLMLQMPLQVVDAMLAGHCFNTLRVAQYPFLCVVETCGRRAAICPGDSGGPVLHDSKVVGISSKGPQQQNCQMMTDATRIHEILFITPLSIHLDWIADVMAKLPKY